MEDGSEKTRRMGNIGYRGFSMHTYMHSYMHQNGPLKEGKEGPRDTCHPVIAHFFLGHLFFFPIFFPIAWPNLMSPLFSYPFFLSCFCIFSALLHCLASPVPVWKGGKVAEGARGLRDCGIKGISMHAFFL